MEEKKSLLYLQASKDGARKLIRENVGEDDIDALVGFLIKDEDLFTQKRANFSLGFKSPIATLKWNECVEKDEMEAEKRTMLHRHFADGGSIKESKMRLLYTAEELKIAIKQLWKNTNLHDACIQKFDKAPNSDKPLFVRTVWKKDVNTKAKECYGYIVRSKFPFLANITSHLDPGSKETVETSNITRISDGEEDFGTILEQTHGTMLDLQKHFGRGGILNYAILDWVQGSDLEWYIVTISNLSAIQSVSKRKNEVIVIRRPVPSWLLDKPTKAEASESAADGIAVSMLRPGEKECGGDFCLDGGQEMRRTATGKNIIVHSLSKCVLMKSLTKARKEVFGHTADAKSYVPSVMNQSVYVCGTCYAKYKELDSARLARTREKMEQEERRKEAEKRKKAVKPKTWKSRVQKEFEASLEEEKEQVKKLMTVQMNFKKQRKIREAAKLGIIIGEEGAEKGSSDEEDGKGEEEEVEIETIEMSEYVNVNEDKDAVYAVTRPASPTIRASTKAASRRATAVKKATDKFLMLLSPQRRKSSVISVGGKEKETEKSSREQYKNFNAVMTLLKRKSSTHVDNAHLGEFVVKSIEGEESKSDKTPAVC